MGYAPAEDPEIAIYVVVDRANARVQDDAKYATRIVRNILTEVLPYMGIFMTEELSENEIKELEALQIEIRTPPVTEEQEGDDPEGESSEEGEGSQEGDNGEESGEGGEEVKADDSWKSFPLDPETGYLVDPNTGNYVDPETGAVYGFSYEGDTSESEE